MPTATGARQRAYEAVEEQRSSFRNGKHMWVSRMRREQLEGVCLTLPELGWVVVDDCGVPTVMEVATGTLLADREVHRVAPGWNRRDAGRTP